MRMVLGFVIAPLVGIIVYVGYIFTPVFFGHGLDYSSVIEGISLALLFSIPIYLLTVAISIPVFLIVRYFHELLWWTSLIAALVVLAIQAFLVKLLRQEDLNELSEIDNLVAAVLGTTAYGLAFWLIARRCQARERN